MSDPDTKQTTGTPCGRCEAGVYHELAIEAGHRMFAGMTKRQALRAAPNCKTEPDRICLGARDFILYEGYKA